MTDYRIWPSTNGPASQGSDSNHYTLAVEFYVTSTAWIKAIHFWCGSDFTGTSDLVGRVFKDSDTSTVSGTTVTFSQPLTAGAWNTATVSPAVQLTANTRYKAAVFYTTPANGYTITQHYFDVGGGASDITNGVLTCPTSANVTSVGQGSFHSNGSVPTFPDAQFNASNFWVDVTVSDVNPNAAADCTATTTVSTTATASRSDAGACTATTTVGTTASASRSDVAACTATRTVVTIATAVRSDAGSATATTTVGTTASATQDLGLVTVTTVVTTTATAIASAGISQGSWWGLWAILQDAAAEAAYWRQAAPVACPNDGEPLETLSDGRLHCRFDGYTYP